MTTGTVKWVGDDRRGSPARESATTAAGIAAERIVLADRERRRRTSRVRSAARRLDRRATASSS